MKKIKKILFSLTVTLMLASPLLSQGFRSFSVDGSIEPAIIRHGTTERISMVEVLVYDHVDLTNVNFKYNLLGGCQLENPIQPDFTKPQTVTVNKNNGDSKDWTIYVKKLTPATLPFELSFSNYNHSEWSNDVVGWAGIGIDTRYPSVIRFGNKGVSFWVAIKEPAKTLSYELTPVSRDPVVFDGEFYVDTSVDGKKWRNITEFNSRKQFSPNGKYEVELKSNVRYIRWTYYDRNRLNINLNNIVIKAE